MSWIKTVSPEAAEGELKEIFEAVSKARGGIAEIHRVQSLNPRAMRAHLDLYKAVVFARSTLGRIARERIAVVVSAANRCAYCVAHHGEALRQLGDNPALVAPLERGELPESLGAADRVLLRWTQLAAREPSQCNADAISELRAVGFDERAILDAALTVAYFSFVNRLVLLLGVEVEGDYKQTCSPVDGGEEQTIDE